MKFLLENLNDHDFEKLTKILERKKIEYKEVKFIPFKATWDIVLEKPYSDYFPLCSVNTMLLSKDAGLDVSFDSERFDYIKFKEGYGRHFINHDLKLIKFADIPNIEEESIFLRDAYGDNLLKGKVLYKNETNNYQDIYHSYLGRSLYTKKIDDGYMMIVSKPKNIQAEYRFFVVNNKVITGSRYMLNRKYSPLNIDNDLNFVSVWSFVRGILYRYCPMNSFVIDIAKMDDHTYKVVECNCINCSGFYEVNLKLLIDEIVMSKI